MPIHDHADPAADLAAGLDRSAISRLTRGEHDAPFDVLGAHQTQEGWVRRAWIPGAARAEILTEADPIPMTPMGEGLFAAALPGRPQGPGTGLIRAGNESADWTHPDPYVFAPLLGELDEHLISEGAHHRLWEALGARPCAHQRVEGVRFAVWAPNARRISVVGAFNDWDGRRHPMRRRGATGVWEIFLPGLKAGAKYKYEILPAGGGAPKLKADPMARHAELRPSNCSIAPAAGAHAWRDALWMEGRAGRHGPRAPVSVYEVHLGSWMRGPEGRWLTYRELAAKLVPYVREMGFTHLEFLPVSEHPFDGSWGYQPTGLYAPTSRYGSPDDFRALIDACHEAELGVILDWVPAHFPADEHGLGQFDGTPLYEHADPREGYHPDWNTLIYNLGRNEVRNYLSANALFWLEEFHADALRVDAVASMLYRDYSRKDGEWIPNKDGGRENYESIDFLRQVNAESYGDHPGIMTIAEESTAWPGVTRPAHDGGLGFGFKWNMGWMHDTLAYMQRDPVHRAHHHAEITFPIHYAFSENFMLPLSHDEVVHGKGSLFGKMPGDDAAKFANLRAYYAFMYAQPGKKLMFMGQEFGQRREWSEERGLDWDLLNDPRHEGLRLLVHDLNAMYRDIPALHRADCDPAGFEWIDGSAAQESVLSWIRHAGDGPPPVMALVNFSGAARPGWRFGAPKSGRWRRILSTEAARYGGAGAAGAEVLRAEDRPWNGRPASLLTDLPPLSATWLLLEED